MLSPSLLVLVLCGDRNQSQASCKSYRTETQTNGTGGQRAESSADPKQFEGIALYLRPLHSFHI